MARNTNEKIKTKPIWTETIPWVKTLILVMIAGYISFELIPTTNIIVECIMDAVIYWILLYPSLVLRRTYEIAYDDFGRICGVKRRGK